MTRPALSVLQMDEVRARFAHGLVSVPALAREYGVGEETIRRVLREAPAEYGKARRKADNKYGTSERGRARRRRADKTYNAAHKEQRAKGSRASRRRRAYGVTDDDIQKMLAAQNYRCPITGRAVDERSSVDHAHDVAPPDGVRGIVTPGINPWLGRTDADLFEFSDNVRKYAGKRFKIQMRLRCSRVPRP